LSKEILSILNKVKGTGNFCSFFSKDFIFPNMEIKGIGDIAFPINELMAKHIISVAHKAPFGNGAKTVLDNNVRSTWEIDAINIAFNGNEWNAFITKQTEKVKKNLGVEDKMVKAFLYKLLVYETGDFFLPHRDSEKEKGMFGTMVINLPSKYVGGDLVVNFEEESAVISFENTEKKINVAAFYADCEHELKPITAGYRVSLVYNLVFENATENVSLESFADFKNEIKACLKKLDVANLDNPTIITLDHQYTPENFALAHLKLNDKYKVKILQEAAKEMGFYAKLCLVTAEIMGAPTYDGYDDDDEDAEMDEIYEENYFIEHWAKDDYPSYGQVSFKKEDLISNLTFDDDEPITKENTGYMGNYGPDLTHWYHYAAVYILPKKAHIEVLKNQNNETQINWINYYSSQSKLDVIETDYIYEKLHKGFKTGSKYSKGKTDYVAILNWVKTQNDIAFFDKQSNEVATEYFQELETIDLVELILFLPQKNAISFIDKVLHQPDSTTIKQLLNLFDYLSTRKNGEKLVANYLLNLPQYLNHLYCHTESTIPLKSLSIHQLILIESQYPQSTQWHLEISDILVSSKCRNYFNNELVNTLITQKNKTNFLATILKNCYTYFAEIATQKPQPPSNWAMQIANESATKKSLQIIANFLADPNLHQFDYRQKQADRDELERAILNSKMDLKTTTIKKGTPHTLQIKKTQATYDLKLKNWNIDMEQFEQIKYVLEII
jgi:2OG-Fe(II) oxygenase superfamily